MEFYGTFGYLPQFRVDADGSVGDGYECRQADACFDESVLDKAWPNERRSIEFRMGLPIHTAGILGMTGMQRYLRRCDQDPFTPESLFDDIMQHDDSGLYRRPDFYETYEPSSPDYYRRHCSPDGTTCSSSSGVSWGACLSDELHSADCSQQYSWSSPRSSEHRLPTSGLVSCYSYPLEISRSGGSCIALSAIQQYPDESLEQPSDDYDRGVKAECDNYDYEHIYCKPKIELHDAYAQDNDDEGNDVSVRDAESVQPYLKDDENSDSDYKPSAVASSTVKRRTRRSSLSSSASIVKSNGRKSVRSRSSSNTSAIDAHNGRIKKKTKTIPSSAPTTARPFPCPFGAYNCHSTFTSKNEWKRHVSTQHIRLGFWRCDLCPAPQDIENPCYNDFNRKDLFTQHLRRMHPSQAPPSPSAVALARPTAKTASVITEEEIAEHQTRCYKQLRTAPPKSGCILCDRTFQGPGSWDDRMEHLGRHFENERKNGGKAIGFDTWREDTILKEWLLKEGLVEKDGRGGWRVGNGVPRRGNGKERLCP